MTISNRKIRKLRRWSRFLDKHSETFVPSPTETQADFLRAKHAAWKFIREGGTLYLELRDTRPRWWFTSAVTP